MKIIAEIGFNHDGDLNKGLELVQKAAKSGANYVKFQTYNEDIALPSSQHFKNIQSSEIDISFHKELLREAKANNVEFLSTPFSTWAVTF